MPSDKYKLSTDWIRKNASKIKKAYFLAISRKYNIYSKDDVLELLKTIDPLNATEENAEVFFGILQLFSELLKKKTGSNDIAEKKIIN